MVSLYGTNFVCFFISFTIISACKNKRKCFCSMKEMPYLFAGQTLKNLVLVNSMNYKRRSNVYNLSYTWSFSTEQSVFVSSFPSLSYQHHLHARTRNKLSVLWKKCHISLQDGLWKIPSWSSHDLSLRNTACLFLHFLLYHISMQEQEKIFSSMKKVPYLLQDGLRNIPSWSILWTTQEDQTCITWVVHGLSLRNKVCLSLHFLLYHISMQEQENFFSVLWKKSVSLCRTDFEKSRLGQLYELHKKIKRVQLEFLLVFLYGTKCVCFFISFSIISAFNKKIKLFCSMKKYRIFLQDGLWKISSRSIIWTTQ